MQPVLEELDHDVEEAAASLGAKRLTIFRRIILPSLVPAITAGAALSFARAIAEYGSLVLLSGNKPFQHRGGLRPGAVLHRERQQASAAAVASLMLAVALFVIVLLDIVQRRVTRKWLSSPPPSSGLLRLLAIGYVFFLVAWPV